MKELQLLQGSLDKATQRGVFSLKEVADIISALNSLIHTMNQVESTNANPVKKTEPKNKK
tara:strand:- start:649 stop:828 length:180 start_codon:yes stop_codon:yes gene_type:complete